PNYWDGMDWVEGDGLCGGFYLRMEAFLNAPDATNLSSPSVVLPNGGSVELLNDGGCGDTGDNTTTSYDWDANDSNFAFGIADPSADHTGDYTFAYYQTDDDMVHVQVDNIAEIKKLDRRVLLTSPTSAAANTDLEPTLTWNAVDGAGAYMVQIWSPGGSYNGPGGPDAMTTMASFTVPTAFALDDDSAYNVRISAMDVDP